MDTKTKRIADSLIKEYQMTPYEAFQIACKIVKNDLFKKAYAVYEDYPTALEAIAIAIGYDYEKPTTIKDALFEISETLENREVLTIDDIREFLIEKNLKKV